MEVSDQAFVVRELRDLPLVGRREHPAADRILERQQSGGSEMDVLRLDGPGDAFDRNAAVRLVFQRLGLNTAENRGPALLVAIRVGLLADQVLLAAAAVSHQACQIALRAGGEEQCTLEAKTL